MHNHLKSTLDRLERVQREKITPRLHERIATLDVESWEVGEDGEPVTPAHALGLATDEGRSAASYTPFEVGQPWGPAWNTTWFRLRGQVPTDAPDLVELVFDLGWFDHSVGGHCEGFVFSPSGTPIKALHPRNTWVRLRGPGAAPDVVGPDGSIDLYIEATATPLLLGLPPFVVTEHGEKGADEHFDEFRLRRADVCSFDPDVWELARDLEVTGTLAAELSEDEPRHWQLLRAVEEALDAYDGRDPGASTGPARDILERVLGVPAHASAHQVTAVGHAHIDSAWLWPLRETVRKVGRTVSNVLALLDSDPDFVYTMSAAQHFVWLEEAYPELFERVRHYVAQGRFIPVGGMWVEADGVLPTGESLVRQMTFGKRYFADRFGIEPEEVWLPDSFGYSGAWPQLARRAGYRWFLTQKISWNDTTDFPHHSFWWEGIDGTRIFTHFPPSDTYAAEVTAAELVGSVANFRDKAIADHSLMAFGYGDGGGGPIREMVGRAHRFADLDGAPQVTMRSPRDFFVDAESQLADVTRSSPHVAPVWSGELYLELHRGTLTSQVAMKRMNRRSESLLRLAEGLSASATTLTGAVYPAGELDDLWRTVLLHQFHDVLPGTSIAWVHREARATYVVVEERLRGLIEQATAVLTGAGHARVRDSAVELAAGAASSTMVDESDGVVLDNGLLRVAWHSNGDIVSFVDHESGRELALAGQPLNQLQIFRDEPVRWDAWDIDRHVLRHPDPVDHVISLRVLHDGADAGVEIVREVGNSQITTTTWLRAAQRQLETECTVHWQERDHLLKVAFPVRMRAQTAQFETQYGVVQRPVHTNSASDEAMFEVGAHRFVRIGEDDLGVGILNDGMHGCDVRTSEGPGRGTVVRISLLRGPSFPDPATDRGTHTFRWAVRPGARLADTVEAACAFNERVLELARVPAPLIGLDRVSGHAVLDWIKLADDGSGDVVVRIYEAVGGRARAYLVLPEILARRAGAWETDLLERVLTSEDDLPRGLVDPPVHQPQGEAVRPFLDLGPFQIATIRIAAPEPAQR